MKGKDYMDITTLLGIGIGLASMIVGFLLEGGHVSALFTVTAFIIVFGGTIGATVASFSMQQLKAVPKLFKITVFNSVPEPLEVINQLVELSEIARREGVLMLEDRINQLDDPFLKQGLQLIVDGTDSEVVRNIMENEIYALEERHHIGASIFEVAGGYAPTMGIIGTVMGLVHVLGNMEDPESLGPSIAVAFLATLYGVGSANIVWLPIATKLKNISKQELFIKELMLEGIISLQAGLNPIIIRERLLAFMSQSMRRKNAGESESDSD